MSIWNVLGKLPLVVFCAFMAFLYINGLLDPVGTDYWIATNGILVLILEFFSIVAAVLIEQTSKIGNAGALPLLVVIPVFVLAFGFSAVYNLQLFVYFVASVSVKAFIVKMSSEPKSDDNRVSISAGASFLSLIFSVFISFFFASSLSELFADKFAILYEFHGSFTTAEANIEVFVFWGIIYFLMVPVMNLCLEYCESKRLQKES